jgi:hypothetical protein
VREMREALEGVGRELGGSDRMVETRKVESGKAICDTVHKVDEDRTEAE